MSRWWNGKEETAAILQQNFEAVVAELKSKEREIAQLIAQLEAAELERTATTRLWRGVVRGLES